jgi:hypothetical protein
MNRPSPIQFLQMVQSIPLFSNQETIPIRYSKPLAAHGLLTPSSIDSNGHQQSYHHKRSLSPTDMMVDHPHDIPAPQALDWFLL